VRVELRIIHGDAGSLNLARRGFAQLGCTMKERDRHDGRWLAVQVPERKLDGALAILQSISELQLARMTGYGRLVPTLYSAGIRYQREPVGREWWQTAIDNFSEREGDCEDLASHRAAELNVLEGEPARTIAVRTGARSFHAVVQRADGTIEDPSAALGMLAPRRRRRFGR
jgi:hypothetical protein